MRHSPSRKARQRAATKKVPALPKKSQYNSVNPPTEMWCFICNSNYWTTVSSGNACQVSITRIVTFCNLFSLRDETERQCLLRLSYLDDPFCTSCSLKINQLQEWIAQLDSLQRGIDSLKSDMGKLMVDSYPDSPNIEGTHHIKANIVRVWESSFSSASHGSPQKNSAADFQPFHDLVQAAHHLTATSKGNTESNETILGIEEVVKDNSEDAYFDEPDDRSDEGSTDYEEEPEPKKRKSGTKKPKGAREPSIRQSSGEKIEAHPDGRCRLCPSTFKSQIQLTKHIRRKHLGIVHPCRYCDKTFQDTSNRKRHEVSVHINQSRDYVCEICGKDYRTPWMLRAHVQKVHEGKILKQHRKVPSQCDECGRVCTSLQNLRTHVKDVHGNVVHKPCSICGRPFKFGRHLNRHERTHMSASDLAKEGKSYYYKCTVCPISFRAKEGLKEHYTTEHPTVPKPKLETNPGKPTAELYPCPECPFHRPFKSKVYLEAHIQNGHSSRKGIFGKHGRNCKICGRPCSNSTRAVLHQGTHHPRGYLCLLCPFSSSRKEDMVHHYGKNHPRVKLPKLETLRNIPFKKYFCPECPEHPGFSQKVKVRIHLKAHRLGTLHELDESEEYKEIGPDDDEEKSEEEEAEDDLEEQEESEEEADDDSESSEEDEDEEALTQEMASRSFSSRGRMLQPPKRFRASTSTRHSTGIEQEVEIPLERIDQNWPKGRVKRIRATGKQENLDPLGEYVSFQYDEIQIEHEEPPLLVTVEDAIKLEQLPVPFL